MIPLQRTAAAAFCVILSAMRMGSFSPRVVLLAGTALFVVSFLTPNWHFEGMGIGAFIEVPRIVWEKFSEGEVFRDWDLAVLIMSLSLGWLSNFTVFFSLPRGAALLAIAAPWVLLLAMTFLSRTGGVDLGALCFIPFYPWALGIGLIHGSRLAACRDITPRTPASASSREMSSQLPK